MISVFFFFLIFVFLIYFILNQLFHSPPSSSRSSLVSLRFLPLEWCHPHIWCCWCLSHLSFQLVTHPAQHFSWCAQHIDLTGWQKTTLSYSFFNLEPVICSIQCSECCFLTHIQVSQETGKMVWFPISLRVFHSLLCSTESKAVA